MTSIVFSALGTGQLGYPKDLVAFLMYDAVMTFDQCHPQTTLKDVRFVLYPKDDATIKVSNSVKSSICLFVFLCPFCVA